MQEVDDLLERLLRLILTGNILECHAGLLFHIHLGLALADVADAAETAASVSADDKARQKRQQQEEADREEHPREDEGERAVLFKFAAEVDAVFHQGVKRIVEIVDVDERGVIGL